MNIKQISPDFFASEQVTAGDLGAVAAQGIKTIFCNRPDQESQGQPDANEIKIAAEAIGIAFQYLPVISGSITDNNIADFGQAYQDAKRPILAYCRTGTRSTSLWALTEAGMQDVDAVLSAAKQAGYDLDAMRPRLLAVSTEAQSGSRE